MQASKKAEKEAEDKPKTEDSQEQQQQQQQQSDHEGASSTITTTTGQRAENFDFASGHRSTTPSGNKAVVGDDKKVDNTTTSRPMILESSDQTVNPSINVPVTGEQSDLGSTNLTATNPLPHTSNPMADQCQFQDGSMHPGVPTTDTDTSNSTQQWGSSHDSNINLDFAGLDSQNQSFQITDPSVDFKLCRTQSDANANVNPLGLADQQFNNFQFPTGHVDSWTSSADATGHCSTNAPFQTIPFATLCSPMFSDQRRTSCTSEQSELSDTYTGPSMTTPLGASPQHAAQIPRMGPPFQNLQNSAAWRHPEKELDIAARRKRPRPAAIGTTGLSRSLMGPSSMSPTTRFSNLSPGHALRHTKSTQTLSPSLNPRYPGVRKVSANQRSPLGLSTFAEASLQNAAKFASESASAVPPLVTTTMAPPTPLTPEDIQNLLPPTPSDNQYCVSPTEDMGCSRFYQMPSQPMQLHVESPPTTPMNVDLLSQYQNQSLAPPLSAPPQYTTFEDYSIPVPSAPMNGGNFHSLSLSPPDHQSQQQHQTLHMPQPTHVSPITYEEPLQHLNAPVGLQQQQQQQQQVDGSQSPQFTVKVSGTPPPPAMPSECSSAGSNKATEFLIQEFPKQQEAHRHVAQLLPPQKHKIYTFANHTPDSFPH